MAADFKLPELGENIEEGEVTRVMVKVGDSVEQDQPLLEVETGKATLEVPSTFAGKVAEVLVEEGAKVSVGQAVLRIDSDAGAEPAKDEAPEEETGAEEPAEEETPPERKEASSQEDGDDEAPDGGTPRDAGEPGLLEFKVPDLGENISEGEVTRVLVAAGDEVSEEQGLFEIETGKATVEIPAPSAGTVKDVQISDGDKVQVGQVVLTLETAGGAKPAAKPAQPDTRKASAESKDESKDEAKDEQSAAPSSPPPPSPPATKAPEKRPKGVPVLAAPSVRKFAREIGISIDNVPGHGERGRVSIDDVKKYAKQLNESRGAAPAAGGAAAPPLPDFATWGSVTREPMSTIRKMTAQHMAACWSTVPHVTQQDKADITELEKLRKKFSKKAEEAGGKLSPTAILIKVAAAALNVFPDFRSSIDMEQQEIIRKDYIHIGVAVDTPKGLLVPVIRDVPGKNIIELAVELTEIAGKAREGKLSPDDMQGACFTISNLGGIGGTHFTPIVNFPEVAILGVGRGVTEPVYRDGEFVPRLMLPLSLSYDHRLIDGAQGARFLRWFADAINEPLRLALEG